MKDLARLVGRALWLVPVGAALWQLWLLVTAIAGRIGYPYDLEWNEGGMLLHALRVGHGGIYAPPSIDFIPFPYTPLYPWLVVALGGGADGVSYLLARSVSVASIACIGAVAAITIAREAGEKRAGAVGATLALGLLAAGYPFVEGWYDIAKPDMLMAALCVAGLAGVRAWARAGRGWRGHARIAAAAATLALAFFCKQTAVFYVAAGGVVLLVTNWRRLPTYVVTASVLGLGGTWLLNRMTDGWFWQYIYATKQGQDFNMPRFWGSFRYLVWDTPPELSAFHSPLYPLGALVLLGALAAVALAAVVNRRLSPGAGGLFTWTWAFAVSCALGAVGWAAPWGHFNHYIPALATGAIAVGAAVPALQGAVGSLQLRPGWAGRAAGLAAALALGVQLAALSGWDPQRFVPSERDRAAGACVLSAIAGVEGDVLIPFHPFYPHLVGKRTFVHRMGVLDMTRPLRHPVAGLRESIAERRFDLIVLDHKGGAHERGVLGELPGLGARYRELQTFPPALRPKVYTGAPTSPVSLYVPSNSNLTTLLDTPACRAAASLP